MMNVEETEFWKTQIVLLRDDIKKDIDQGIGGLRKEFEGLRGEFKGLRDEFSGLRKEFAELNKTVDVKIEGLRKEFSGLRDEFVSLHKDVVKALAEQSIQLSTVISSLAATNKILESKPDSLQIMKLVWIQLGLIVAGMTLVLTVFKAAGFL